jgi:hypothetical protein
MASAGTKSKKKGKGQKPRQERRFEPRPAARPVVVQLVGGAGAVLLGAGAWAQFGHQLMESASPPYSFAPALIAGGAVLFGVAVWLGTSGEAVLRVGSGGVGYEKAKEVVRMPWHAIERIVWDPDKRELAVSGANEMGGRETLTLPAKVHPAALGWIVQEARARVPDVVDVPDEAAGLPEARPNDGELLAMDAVQVVGKRCAQTGRIIAYEPDARVCPKCERVYYKLDVPETCACGASLAAQRDALSDATTAEV